MTIDQLANKYYNENLPPIQERRLKNRIAQKAKPYISKIIKRINTPSKIEYSYEDLEQEAMYMVFKSLENYLVDNDNKFSTYMYIRVRGRVIQYIRNNDTLTRTQRNQVGEIRQAVHEVEQQKGREPSPSEVAAATDLSTEEVIGCLTAHNSREHRDIEEEVIDFIPGVEDPLKAKFDREQLLHKMRALSVNQRVVLILYYFYGMTGREIATLLDLTLFYIYRLKKQSIQILKEIHYDAKATKTE